MLVVEVESWRGGGEGSWSCGELHVGVWAGLEIGVEQNSGWQTSHTTGT